MATIVCADDEKMFLDVYEKLFAADGHDVIKCECGEAALGAVEAHDVDLVLLDVGMPGIDGIETCRMLRETNPKGQLPIIMVSGLSAEETVERGKVAGADDYVLKPFQPHLLTAKVEHLLAKQGLHALPNLELGDTFNERYKVRRKVSQDELVTVYLAAAEDVMPPQTIILTLYEPTGDGELGVPLAYERDVEVLTGYDHANLVDIYDHGCADGVSFTVTEYVDGTNLRELVNRKGGLPTSYLGVIGIQLLHLLEFFQYKGVVHRGLSPDAIQLTSFADVKIRDFRLATSINDAGIREYKKFDGDAEYSAPEYLGAKALDHACDVFSVGAAMYFGALGKAPFEGDSQMEVLLKQHRGAPPKINDVTDGFGDELCSMIAEMIQLDPNDRPAVRQLIKKMDVILATTHN